MDTRNTLSIQPGIYYINPNEIKSGTVLARGSYGAVYLAMWQNKTVVIKKMDVKCKYATLEINMMKELAALKTPNVVQFLGSLHLSDEVGIVMEYMPKGDLLEYIYFQPNPIDWTVRHAIMTDLINGLKHMHDYRIVHRDIKPANVLLDENMHAKLSDFGFTKYIDDTIQAAGSIGYTAPEVVKKEMPHEERSDIFSLGITFAMLANWNTDSYPQFSSDVMDIVKFVATGGRPTLKQDCPPSISKLITFCWQQDINDRCDAKYVKEELNRFMPSN